MAVTRTSAAAMEMSLAPPDPVRKVLPIFMVLMLPSLSTCPAPITPRHLRRGSAHEHAHDLFHACEHLAGGNVAVVENEGVRGPGLVAEKSDLGDQLRGCFFAAHLVISEPGRKVGRAHAGEDGCEFIRVHSLLHFSSRGSDHPFNGSRLRLKSIESHIWTSSLYQESRSAFPFSAHSRDLPSMFR